MKVVCEIEIAVVVTVEPEGQSVICGRYVLEPLFDAEISPLPGAVDICVCVTG